MPFEPMHALNDGLCFDSAASCGLWPHLDPRAALAETGSPARFGAWGGSRQGEHPPQSPQPQGLDGKTPPKPLKGGCPPDRVLGSGYRVVRMSAAPCGCGKAIIGDGEGGAPSENAPATESPHAQADGAGGEEEGRGQSASIQIDAVAPPATEPSQEIVCESA